MSSAAPSLLLLLSSSRQATFAQPSCWSKGRLYRRPSKRISLAGCSAIHVGRSCDRRSAAICPTTCSTFIIRRLRLRLRPRRPAKAAAAAAVATPKQHRQFAPQTPISAHLPAGVGPQRSVALEGRPLASAHQSSICARRQVSSNFYLFGLHRQRAARQLHRHDNANDNNN